VRIAIVFDVDAETGYRIGEYLDSDIQPVFLVYRNRLVRVKKEKS
jgi:hypothetical protein